MPAGSSAAALAHLREPLVILSGMVVTLDGGQPRAAGGLHVDALSGAAYDGFRSDPLRLLSEGNLRFTSRWWSRPRIGPRVLLPAL